MKKSNALVLSNGRKRSSLQKLGTVVLGVGGAVWGTTLALGALASAPVTAPIALAAGAVLAVSAGSIVDSTRD